MQTYFTVQQIEEVVDCLIVRYSEDLFSDSNSLIINNIWTLEEIPIGFIQAWKNERGRYIQGENREWYEQLLRGAREEQAIEILTNERRLQVVRRVLQDRQEKLEEQNAKFRDEENEKRWRKEEEELKLREDAEGRREYEGRQIVGDI